jgi:hypothetical protein|tara:strand:+ start:582 stop:752 length:171 start_codon:yes stop_codon:yes gene_type:complete
MRSEIMHVSVDYREPFPVIREQTTLAHIEGNRDVPPCHEMLDAVQTIFAAVAKCRG